MPPRRGTRRKAAPTKEVKKDESEQDVELDVSEGDTQVDGDADQSQSQANEPNVSTETDLLTEEDIKSETVEAAEISTEADTGKEVTANGDKQSEEGVDLPFKVKVSHLPAVYILGEFHKYIKSTFRMKVPKIISPAKNSPWLLIPFASKEEQENLIKNLHNHVWKKKTLRAIAFHAIDTQKRKRDDGEEDPDDPKKSKLEEIPVLTLEEEILSESLPLYNVPYEEQNRLTVQDVELLSSKLHAFMCVRNPDLAGWAEAMCEKNGGFIYKIEPLKPSPFLEGYRNKCKFRIGKNADGETTVGFCLNDNENKILGVQPGDKLIHLPDSMKYAAKKFEEYIRESGKEPYDKKKKTGFWDHIIIRIAPEGDLMLVVVMYHNQLSDEAIKEIKKDVKNYFVNGKGNDCNLFSLYFQVMNDKAPILPPDKLELLEGEPSFEEHICGLKFHVGPFTILNVNSPSAENIYKSISELAEPTSETTVIDICSGTGGIAFTIAEKCEKVIAIESQEDNVNDALKTKELNSVQNVEFIKGKVEDELANVFKNLGDKQVIPIIDPPRQGLVQKAVSQLRAHAGIKKLVYVCSNSKMGVKNFLDMCASAEKKEGTFGNPLNVEFVGLPFLPVKAVPVDVAPYTVNNTIVILFERIDPSTFPPAKNPPPQPLKKPQVKKDEKKKGKKPQGRGPQRGNFQRGGGRRFPPPAIRGRFMGPPRRDVPGRGIGGGPVGPNRGRYPQPLMRPLDPALSLVAKYERRIAELEQQDRAFKAGLTMGLQVMGSRSGGSGTGTGGGDYGGFDEPNFRNVSNYSSAELFESYRGNYKDPYGQQERSPWQQQPRSLQTSSFESGVGYGAGVGINSFRGDDEYGAGGSGYGAASSFSRFGSGSGGGFGASRSNLGNGFGERGNYGNGFGAGMGSGGFGRFGGGGGGNNFGNYGGGNNFNSKFGGGGFRNHQGNKQRR